MQSRIRTSQAIFVLLLGSISSGCSINKAITQPEKKDLTVLMPGNSRAEVIAEVGNPQYQENLNGAHRDVYSFQQGYSKPVKVGRAIGHGFGLFATFGLWELAGYPIELALNGEDVRVQVDYDPEMIVTDVTYFRGAHLRENGPTLPQELYSGKSKSSDDVVTLTRDASGNLLVLKGVKPPHKIHDETRVAERPGPQPVNEATYFSSSEREPSVKASQISGSKLR